MTIESLAALIKHEPSIIKLYLTMLTMSGVDVGEPFSFRMRDISDRANMQISSLYRHFPVMEQRGLLQIVEHGQGRSTNMYRLLEVV